MLFTFDVSFLTVFSEAEFDIHDLEKIVQNTDSVIFILTVGILESEWCIKELRSAIRYQKQIIIIRELSFKIPSPLPPKLQDLEPVFRESPMFTWIAEYHHNCVNKMKETVLGPPDALVEKLKIWMKKNNVEKGEKDQKKE